MILSLVIVALIVTSIVILRNLASIARLIRNIVEATAAPTDQHEQPAGAPQTPAGTPAAANPAGATPAPATRATASATTPTAAWWKLGLSRLKWLLLHIVVAAIAMLLILTYPTWAVNVFSWRPDLDILLVIMLFGIVFLLLAPKTTEVWAKRVVAGIIATFAVLLVLALIPTGLGELFQRKAAEINACLKDPNCPTTPPETKQVQRDTRIQSVKIIECRLGWSRVVPVRGHSGTVYWNWRVRANYLRNKQWYEHIPDTNVDADAFRYCHDGELAGKDMPLDWR